MTVPTRFRDAKSVFTYDQGGTDPTAGCRPGFRMVNDRAALDAKEQAYRDAAFANENAWRIGDRRSKKTKYNRSGDLEGTEEIEEESETHSESGSPNDAALRLDQRAANYSPPVDHKTVDVAKLRKDHEARMQTLYDQRDREDAEAYKMKDTHYE